MTCSRMSKVVEGDDDSGSGMSSRGNRAIFGILLVVNGGRGKVLLLLSVWRSDGNEVSLDS